ncbi:MAG: TIR domain-containing protein [Pseudomonadales bacterium]
MDEQRRDIAAPNYMAFISYRHADNAEEDRQWATWLHQQLEVYDVPHDLVGERNLRGEDIPDRIYPVFRDEVSLPADADLSSAITHALDSSDFLVVLCSPRAVQSRYVNEEILHFKRTGKQDRIIAALILGEPNASIDDAKSEDPEFPYTLECFPPSLQYNLNERGELNRTQPTEPIAANFRLPKGKGLTNPGVYKQQLLEAGSSKKDAERLSQAYEEQITIARLKIIAGILGVPLERLMERDKVHQLKKAREASRRAKKFIAVVSVLLVLALIGGGIAVDQYMRAQGEYERAQAEYEKAEQLLGSLRTNLNFMNFELRDVLKKYVPVIEQTEVSERIDSMVEILDQHGGGRAEDRYRQAIAYEQKADLILRSGQMDRDEALPLYQKANELFQDLVETGPDNIAYQQDLAISYNKLGAITLRLGNAETAQKYHKSGLVLVETLVNLDPDNIGYQRSLARCYQYLGDTALELGDNNGAQRYYGLGFEVLDAVVKLHSDNPTFKRDLSLFYSRLGRTALLLGNAETGQEYYGLATGVSEVLVELYPGNVVYQRDLSISYNNLGDTALILGEADMFLGNGATLWTSSGIAARRYYRLAFDLAQTLVALDPNNTVYQRDLSVSYGKLGDIFLNRLADPQGAVEYYRLGLRIHEMLVVLDRNNTQYKGDLLASYEKLGATSLRLGDIAVSKGYYSSALKTAKTLMTLNPDNPIHLEHMSNAYENLADVAIEEGDYSSGLEMVDKLMSLTPSNAEHLAGISIGYKKLGDMALAAGDTEVARGAQTSGLEIVQRLVRLDPDSAKYQRDLMVGYWKLGEAYLQENRKVPATKNFNSALNKLLWMQKKGILDKNDEQYIQDFERLLVYLNAP